MIRCFYHKAKTVSSEFLSCDSFLLIACQTVTDDNTLTWWSRTDFKVSTPHSYYQYSRLSLDHEHYYGWQGYLLSFFATWVQQKLLIAFCESTSKVCCTGIAAYMWCPVLVSVPSQAAKVMVVSFPDFQGNGTLLWWKNLPQYQHNRNYPHF
jgi:hypothetical protein